MARPGSEDGAAGRRRRCRTLGPRRGIAMLLSHDCWPREAHDRWLRRGRAGRAELHAYRSDPAAEARAASVKRKLAAPAASVAWVPEPRGSRCAGSRAPRTLSQSALSPVPRRPRQPAPVRAAPGAARGPRPLRAAARIPASLVVVENRRRRGASRRRSVHQADRGARGDAARAATRARPPRPVRRRRAAGDGGDDSASE